MNIGMYKLQTERAARQMDSGSVQFQPILCQATVPTVFQTFSATYFINIRHKVFSQKPLFQNMDPQLCYKTLASCWLAIA